jgi:hypothetical protein
VARLPIENMFDNTDALLAKTRDRLHRKILINWRRHACLEVMGRYQEILTREMTVDEPVYRLHDEKGQTTVLSGRAAVEGFYRQITETGANVMVGVDDYIAVNDWGFSIESNFNNFVPGRVLVAMGVPVDDPDATYLVTYPQVMVWHYTSQGLLIGENVYGGTRTITKPAPEDVITPAEANRILTPILAETPPH